MSKMMDAFAYSSVKQYEITYSLRLGLGLLKALITRPRHSCHFNMHQRTRFQRWGES